MTTYILDRSKGTLIVTIKETGVVVPLYRDIYDTGVTPATFGDHPITADGGGSDQLAFALFYHYTKDINLSIAKYSELARHLKHAVPDIIEISAEMLSI